MFMAEELEKSLKMQKQHAWDLEKDIPWQVGPDLTRPFVSLSKIERLFPGASAEQKLVISQYIGLVVAATISEMEKSLMRLKNVAWENILRKHPVNPEFIKLGENFFEEELKHSKAFEKYISLVGQSLGATSEELMNILPRLDDTKIEKIFEKNAELGGHGLWWVVAAVEEESILIYKHLRRFKEEIDPLYFRVHQLHFQEEARHASYAFMMLDLFRRRGHTPIDLVHRKIDLICSEALQITWVFQQLIKIFKVKKLAHKNEWFATLNSALPLLLKHRPWDLVQALFTETPYFTPILNTSGHPNLNKYVEAYGAMRLPLPEIDLKEIYELESA